jgi:hypothetical protein
LLLVAGQGLSCLAALSELQQLTLFNLMLEDLVSTTLGVLLGDMLN